MINHIINSLTIFIFLLSTSFVGLSQAPDIEWQNTIGSDGDDILVSIHQTFDGGYILGGYSWGGISGDKTEMGLGFADYWVIKLNSFGVIVWQNTIGGNSNDKLTEVQITSNGGYILGGYSDSGVSGDKTEASLVGSNDYWVVKIDDLGNIQWQNTIGGAGNDEFHSIAETSDGGYILGGRSNSPISGDKTEASDEYYDYWIVKLDSTGSILWENTIGGNEFDYLYSVLATQDNGCIIGGMSSSNISGDKTDAGYGTGGTGDFWILKIDSLGNIQWQNAIGGNSSDWLMTIKHTIDGGFILGGYSASNISGDKTENNWGDPPVTNDYWVVKIDTVGTILGQNTIGGSYDDRLYSLQSVDSGYIVGGYSFSGISGDKTEPNIGFEDYWSVKLDSINSIGWQKTSGGWVGDLLAGIEVTFDNGYILGGYTNSPISGDKTEEPIGANDYWVIKLKGDCTNSTFYIDYDGDGFGGNSDSILACFTPTGYVANNLDCNDTIETINPSEIETCNYLDDNCNFLVDEGLPLYTNFLDSDADTYGNALIDTTACLSEIIGYSSDSTDCDDTDSSIHIFIIYYTDADTDLFGDALTPVFFCSNIPPSGFVSDSTDCDDNNPFIYPSAEEILNNLDDNCNDSIDEGLVGIIHINSFDFEIYPNPNNGNFRIIIKNSNREKIKIEINNLLGEKIYETQFYAEENLIINLPQPYGGIANIRIKIGNYYINKLIVINK